MDEEIPCDLDGLKPYLEVLDLPTSTIPTLEATRKAFRAKLKLHPDKQGESFNKIFQTITQAFRIIDLFVADNIDHGTAAENKEDDIELLAMLEKKNRLAFNKTSVTLPIEKESGEAWMTVLEKKIDATREALADKVGFRIKNDNVKIPHANIEVCVAVRIWPNPKGTPKMVVEGAGYWPFVMCILPSLIRKVKDLKASLCLGPPAQLALGVGGLPGPHGRGGAAGHSSQHNSASDSPNPASNNINVTTKVSDALSKVEASVVDVGSVVNDRLEKIESQLEELTKAVKSIPNKKELSGLSESLACVTKTVQESVVDIKNYCKSVSEVTIKLTETDLEEVSQKVADSIAPTVKEAVNENFVSLTGKVENLSKVTENVDKQLRKCATEQTELKDNLAGLPKLVSTLQSALENPNTGIKIGPNKPPENAQNSPSNGPNRRKGVIFTSGIGKSTDVEKVRNDLNSDIELYVTDYIERNEKLTDPDAFLTQKVNQVMKSEHDYVIIQIGSNEMSQLELGEDKGKVFASIQDDCEKLVNLAKHLVSEYNVDVFISEKPPRYDEKTSEFGGILEGLNNTSNSILHMQTHMLDRVWMVKQSMLDSKSDRVKKDRFMPDGLNLTEKGVFLLNSNWVDQIKKVYSDLQSIPIHAGGGDLVSGSHQGQDVGIKGQNRGDRYSNGERGFGDRNPRKGNGYGGNNYGGNRFGDRRFGENSYGARRFGENSYGARKFGENSYGSNRFGDNYGGNRFGENYGGNRQLGNGSGVYGGPNNNRGQTQYFDGHGIDSYHHQGGGGAWGERRGRGAGGTG